MMTVATRQPSSGCSGQNRRLIGRELGRELGTSLIN
ncbi:hypothetical protein DESC_460163 [Desulfosarcina cetonica]|nr:hypothetical protein DESC_460163 [Desulfosarcina cetonica]